MTQTADDLRQIVDEMSGMFYERGPVIRALVVTMLARQHALLLGPPGAAKSELARELTSRITGGTYWEILLSKFTTPPQIFGPVDVAALTARGEFRQVLDGHATQAHIGFIDEIFKCGDAALNVLWEQISQRPAVEREVLAMVNPDAREALDLLDAINELAAELDAMAGQSAEKLSSWGFDANQKLKRAAARLDSMHDESEAAGRSTTTLDPIIARCREVRSRVASEALGI